MQFSVRVGIIPTDALNTITRAASDCLNDVRKCAFQAPNIPSQDSLPKRKAGVPPPPPPPQLVAVPDLTGTHVGFPDSFALVNALQLGIHPRNAVPIPDNCRNFEIVNQEPKPTNNGLPNLVPTHSVIEVDFLSS